MSSAGPPVPDLLCADARLRVSAGALRQALVFAFAAGAPQAAFDDVVAAAALPPSSWERPGFGRDVYIDEIVDKCLALRIGGNGYATCRRYVARVLVELSGVLRTEAEPQPHGSADAV